ncbi:SMC family ATPase, partial [Pseudonocardia sp.]|uniref:SMC family ATPase n=1 Tax=Pseudonocardia sp. TaxID=60912 RepID=UPI0031FD4998
MRPVLLEMAGFASFREPTSVDFTGAEYFALVGPTGSGKSTVIDAMTFALYGSVPRWDNSRTVALALAPTVGRGTVRLVFDVGGARYVAARELRRAATGSVSVRSARLERLRDAAGLGGADEETEPLADGAGAVTKAVEELLGLPFGDFCTCVVLPQGDFAEFLHTEPRKRQEKLVRILGLGVYDVIAREANSEAAAQRQRSEVLAEQLTAYSDATPDAEQAAAERASELEALAERVSAAVPELAGAAAALGAAEEQVAQLRGEQERLAALTVPDGLAELDARQRAAAAEQASAAARAATAESADTDARERLAAAPARGPLEQARRHHAELVDLTAELPGARERHEKASAAYATAVSDAADARASVEDARSRRDDAAVALTSAQEAVRRLTAERDGLRSVAVPAGLDALDRRRSEAAAALDRADGVLAEAETADARARGALAAAPARAPLEQARRDRRDLDGAEQERRSVADRVAGVEREVAAAAAMAAEAQHRLDHAQEQHALAQRADLAAALRPTLAMGDPCPVCTQVVATLPAPLPGGPDVDHEGPERAVVAAGQAHDEARRREAAAEAAREQIATEAERLDVTIARMRSALQGVLPAFGPQHEAAGAPPTAAAGGAAVPEALGPDPAPAAHASTVPSAAEIDSALVELDRLATAADDAAAAVRGARRRRDGAAAAVEGLRVEVTAAAAGLRAARDPLVPLGAPAVDDGNVLSGWTALVEWSREAAASRQAALPSAQDAALLAEREREAAEETLRTVDRAAAERRRDETAAARTEQDARGAVEAIERRTAQLEAALAGAPSDADAAAELHRLDALDVAVREADEELRGARTALRSAERVAAEVGREITAAWNALRHARDPLVPLGAPA